VVPQRSRNDPERFPARAAIVDELPETPKGNESEKSVEIPKPTTVTTSDPEFQRPRVVDTDETPSSAQKTSESTVVRRPQAGDPEVRPRFATMEDVGDAVKKGELSVLEAVQVRRAMAHDLPRFPKGEGLDSDGAKEIARPKIEVEADPSQTDVAAIAALAQKEPQETVKPFDELVEQSRKNQRMMRELAGVKDPAKGDGTPSGGKNSKEPGRNEQAAKLLDALAGGMDLTQVRGQVTDGTGKTLVPARVRIVDGTGSAVDAPLNDGFYVRGDFLANVILGLVKVEVHRGRFFSSSSTSLKASQAPIPSVAATIDQSPLLNFAKQGWYLADLDIGLRTEPGERSLWRGTPPTLEDLELAAEAEGVQAIGVQLPRGDAAEAQKILDRASGAAKNGVLILPVFPGPRHVFQGVVSGLGVKSNEGLAWEINDPIIPLHDAFEDIRAQGGLSILRNFGGLGVVDIKGDLLPLVPGLRATNYFHERDVRARLYAATSFPYETVAGGGYDAIAFDGSPAMEKFWYGLLNQGFEIPIVGAGGGSLEGGRRPYGQTLVQCGPKLSRQSLLDGIKRGRTVVSFGPVVFARVADRDRGPGDWMPANGQPQTLQIQAYSSMLPGMQLDKIEIIRNGKVLHTQVATEGETAISNLQWTFTEANNAWYVLRVTERRNKTGGAEKGGTAWSSPLYFHSATHTPPQRAQTRLTGTLRSGAAGVKGSLTVVVADEAERQIETDEQGRFNVLVPSRAAIVFSAPGCEPVAKRIFEHPDIQKKFGELQAEREGAILEQLSKAALYSMWRLQLSELEWEVSLPKVK